MKRLAPTALLAVTTLMVLGACTPDPVDTPTPTPSTTSASPTVAPSPTPAPSASPSPTSTLSPEQEAAQAAAAEYFRALSAVRSDLEADFQPVADATTGTFTSAVAEVINSYRSIGAVQVGDITYTYKGVGPVVEAGGVTSVEVRVCGDASNSDMVNANGESVLEADRPRFIDYRLDVVQVGNSWRVNGGPSEAVESC
jgi:hypothetical protein